MNHSGSEEIISEQIEQDDENLAELHKLIQQSVVDFSKVKEICIIFKDISTWEKAAYEVEKKSPFSAYTIESAYDTTNTFSPLYLLHPSHQCHKITHYQAQAIFQNVEGVTFVGTIESVEQYFPHNAHLAQILKVLKKQSLEKIKNNNNIINKSM
jgi:hypothetical protein